MAMRNLVWSKRVGLIHLGYILTYPLVLVTVLLLVGFGVGRLIITDVDTKWCRYAACYINRVFLAMVAAQILSARVIFRGCPLTILEHWLRGDDMSRYWAVRKVSPRWTVLLLVVVPVAIFVLIVTFNFVIGFPPNPV